MGTLYVVATPIGNLKDITLRAIEILGSVDVIASEDTRKTGFLLRHLTDTVPGFSNRPLMISYYDQTEHQRLPGILNLLTNDKNVALVSDAGTPAISDPGFKLIRECVQQGIKVEAIPGPSSVITALVSSGLPPDKFLFVGYLPKKQGNRTRTLNDLLIVTKTMKVTVVLFETPHRLLKTLEEMKNIFGDISLSLARELTKVHEEIRYEKISKALEHFQKSTPKGEFVLLFNTGEEE